MKRLSIQYFIYTQGMNQLFRYYAGFLWIFVDMNIPLKINLLADHKYFIMCQLKAC